MYVHFLPVLSKILRSLNFSYPQDRDSAVIRSTMEYQPGTLKELLMAGSDLRLRNKVNQEAFKVTSVARYIYA